MKLFFYETKFNSYSINALLGSLDHMMFSEDQVKIVSEQDISQNSLSKSSESVIFCFSFCTPQMGQIAETVKKVKTLYPDAIIVAGGPHPSGEPNGTLELGFDHVFVGEAEQAFIEFLKNMNSKRIIKCNQVNLDNYKNFSLKFKRFSPIEITRGCPFACKFCQTSYLFGTKPRHRSIDSIIRQVESLLSFRIRDLRFITPNALSYGSDDGKSVNLQAIEELLKGIKSLSSDINIYFGTFPSEIRPEHLTKEVLSAIKPYIANKSFTIGAQSGSDKVLERINRGHTTEDVYNAVKNALDAGFSANVDFIFGLPDEDESSQNETVDFIERLIKLSHNKGLPIRIHSHYFIPLAGTPYYKAKPSKLSKKLTKYLGRLYNQKLIFGQFHVQKNYYKDSLSNIVK